MRVGTPVAMVPDACGTGCGVEGGVAGAGGGAEGAAAVVVLAISREVAAADAIAGSSGGDCAVEAVPACGSAATGRLALAAAIRARGAPMWLGRGTCRGRGCR